MLVVNVNRISEVWKFGDGLAVYAISVVIGLFVSRVELCAKFGNLLSQWFCIFSVQKLVFESRLFDNARVFSFFNADPLVMHLRGKSFAAIPFVVKLWCFALQ